MGLRYLGGHRMGSGARMRTRIRSALVWLASCAVALVVGTLMKLGTGSTMAAIIFVVVILLALPLMLQRMYGRRR